MTAHPIGLHKVAVHLHGPLGDRFGDRHDFAVGTPIEAIRALDANYPGFMNAFREHEHYAIYADGDWYGDEHLNFPVAREVHFCPVIEGRAFLGAALVTAIFPAITGTTATIIGGVLMTGLLLGVSLLFAPKKAKSKSSKDENYSFSGADNVTEQGAPVPLIYGRVHAGTVVVSAGLELDVEYVAVPSGSSTGGPHLLALAHDDLVPPAGGWPPIVDGRRGKQPYGWDYAVTQTTTRDNVTIGVDVYLSPTNPQGTVYAWTEKRGFYSFVASTTQPLDQVAG